MSEEIDKVFSACNNAYEDLRKSEGKEVVKMPCSRKECKMRDCFRHPNKHQGENSP